MSLQFWAGFVAGWMALNFLCLITCGLALFRVFERMERIEGKERR